MTRALIALALLVSACAPRTATLSAGASPSGAAATPTRAVAAPSTSCVDPASRDPIKCSTPPPGYTPPPSPKRYVVRTAAEVLAGLRTDPFVSPSLTFGDPVFVPALRSEQRDEWLVPVVDGAAVRGVVSVDVLRDGTGSAGISSGWSGPFPHQLSPQAALAVASAPQDASVTAQLAWAVIDPRSGGPASELLPFYLVTRQSGVRVLVMQSGYVVSEAAAGR